MIKASLIKEAAPLWCLKLLNTSLCCRLSAWLDE